MDGLGELRSGTAGIVRLGELRNDWVQIGLTRHGKEFILKLKISEQMIFNSILDWLSLMRIPHVKIRNTGLIIHRAGKTIFGRNGRDQKGAPDILLCYKGKAVGIEVKSEKGVISAEQDAWHKKWRNAGGLVIVVRNLDTVINFIGALERHDFD